MLVDNTYYSIKNHCGIGKLYSAFEGSRKYRLSLTGLSTSKEYITNKLNTISIDFIDHILEFSFCGVLS